MKKVFFIALFLIPYCIMAQEGEFDTQNAYEVGQDYSVSFEITDSVVIDKITKVEWFFNGTTGDIVSGELEQVSNVTYYVTNFPDPIYVSEFNNGNGNEVDFTLGNFALANDPIRIIVTYIDTSGQPGGELDINDFLSVNIITQPTVSGPSDIQECCVTTVTYTASGYENANEFDWSINPAGGTIVVDNGTNIIVQPSLTNPISVDCQVSRQESVPAYNYSNSMTTTRSQVVTPPIQGIPTSQGIEYLCLGDIYELFLDLDGFCGEIEDVIWTIPQDFEIQSIDDEVVTIAPTSSMLYQSFDIKAQIVMVGGCLATTVTHNVTIFQNGTPPTPQGYIAVTSDPSPIAPCEDYFLFFDFVQTDGFQNGIITMTPKVFIGVPHHRRGDTVNVRVCYYNPCSGIETCTTFVVDLPEPCPTHPRITNSSLPIAESQKYEVVGVDEEEVRTVLQEVQIYPNPTKGILHINYPDEELLHTSSRIRVMDISGKVVLERQKIQRSEILDLKHLVQGLYVVEVFLNDGIVRTLIVVE